ncbi:hypothetical protein RF034_00040, partial [Serratia marcescens]|uniref:hypothetical protein n=1 Tax=Serratia marcescens TaxID=615 RepID=UPI002812C5EE
MQVEKEHLIEKWFKIPNSIPHVTLYLSRGCHSKDLRQSDETGGGKVGSHRLSSFSNESVNS